ncbi:MAG: hypothetical protein GY754_35830 [bacterium]|nr:hypothetical protein [bacterium]
MSDIRKKVPENKIYERELTPAEHKFSRSPVFVVTVTAQIKGEVKEEHFKNAVLEVRKRHPLLRCRIKEDRQHNLLFTTDGAEDIEIEVIPREKPDHWITVYNNKHTLPFDFEKRPPIRFVLVQSTDISELIILCHHVICDGKSLAYLVRDVMEHLGDQSKEAEILPDPVLMNAAAIPGDAKLNPLIKILVNRINKKWMKERIYFDQEDYLNLNEAYWKKYTQEMVPIVLSEEQTENLVARCKREGVTVNSALTLAFAGAEQMIQASENINPLICIVGSVRERLIKKVGEVMGFYAGFTSLKYKYNEKPDFWDNARKFHKKAARLYTVKNFLEETIIFQNVDTSYIDAITCKMYGNLVEPGASRYEKLSAFNKRGDVLLNILKKKKVTDAESVIMGTMMTNLTRLDFPKKYGSLELVHLIMHPGVSGHFNLLVGALTCANKLSILLTNIRKNDTPEMLEAVRDRGLELLSVS